MWKLTVKTINRLIAHGLAGLIVKCAGWFGRRYASWFFLILSVFVLVSLGNDHVGDWADYLGVFTALFVPFCLFGVALAVFLWCVSAHAIEPAKASELLKWAEEEMTRLELINHPELESAEKVDQLAAEKNDQSLAPKV